jgi:hypothetical protein
MSFSVALVRAALAARITIALSTAALPRGAAKTARIRLDHLYPERRFDPRGHSTDYRRSIAMASAEEFRTIAVSFETWARTASTRAERRDFLEMAKTMRQAAGELDASAATVRQLDRRKTQAPNPPRSAG